MKFYKDVPLDIVEDLYDAGLHQSFVFTLYTTCSPWDELRFEYNDENGEDVTLVQKLGYHFEYDNLGSNLLFDIVNQTECDACLGQLKALITWFRKEDGVHWVRFHSGSLLDIKWIGCPFEFLEGEDMEEQLQVPWEEPEFNVHQLNVLVGHASKLSHDEYKPVNEEIWDNDKRMIATSSGVDVTQHKTAVVGTHEMRHSDRDRILSDSRSSHVTIVRTIACVDREELGDEPPVLHASKHRGGVGVVSLWRHRRVPCSDFVREYVELDERYPQFVYHITRMNADPLIKAIVLDHRLDDIVTRMCGEKVVCPIHEAQFKSLSAMLGTGVITKPLIVYTPYHNIGKQLFAAGAFVASTKDSLLEQLDQTLELFVMNGVLNHTTTITEIETI